MAKEIQLLSGGSGQLKNLVCEYESRTCGFGSVPPAPVIVVTDVDKGAKELFKVMGKFLNEDVAGDKSWYFLFKNLYVVPIPLNGAKSAEIEDLFDQKTLDTKLGGKVFDRTNAEEDGDRFYSKFTFATKVVSARSEVVDFSRFSPLLQALTDVQIDYARRLIAVQKGLGDSPTAMTQ